MLGTDWVKLPQPLSSFPLLYFLNDYDNCEKKNYNFSNFPHQPTHYCCFNPGLFSTKVIRAQSRKRIAAEQGPVEMAGTVVRRMKLGSQGIVVSAQGLGCMGMSYSHGPPKPEEDMIKVIRHAVSRGVTLLDTSDGYGPHTNEILIGKVL